MKERESKLWFLENFEILTEYYAKGKKAFFPLLMALLGIVDPTVYVRMTPHASGIPGDCASDLIVRGLPGGMV